MKFKKILSTIAAIAIAASSFAGLGITANAAEATTVYEVDYTAASATNDGWAKHTSGAAGPTLTVTEGTGLKMVAGYAGKTSTARAFDARKSLEKAYEGVVTVDTTVTWIGVSSNKAANIYNFFAPIDSAGNKIFEIGADGQNKQLMINGAVDSAQDSARDGTWTISMSIDFVQGKGTYSIMNGDTALKSNAEFETTSANFQGFSAGVSADTKNPKENGVTIKNIKVTQKESDLVPVGYTVKFVDEESTELKASDTSRQSAVGTAVTANNSDKDYFEVDGQRYIYKSCEGITLTDTAENNILTIVYRKANTFDLKAVASTDEAKVFASETVTECDNFSYVYPKYLVDDNKKVIAQTTAATYGQTITPSKSETIQVPYTAYTGTAYFVEGESAISDSTVMNDYKLSSNGAVRGIQTGLKEVITVPESGTYKLTVCGVTSYVGKKSALSVYKNDESSLLKSIGLDYASVNKIATDVTENVLLNAGDKIMVKGAESNSALDYVLLERTGDLPPVISAATMTVPSGITEPKTTTAKEVDRKTGTVASDSPVALTGVKTVYIKVDNAVENVMPTVKVGEETYTPSYKYTAGTSGYFVYQFVGIDLTNATVTYEGAAEKVVDQIGDGGSEVIDDVFEEEI